MWKSCGSDSALVELVTESSACVRACSGASDRRDPRSAGASSAVMSSWTPSSTVFVARNPSWSPIFSKLTR